jgi:hypothetical protein
MKKNLGEVFRKLGLMSLVATAAATGCGVEPMEQESGAGPVTPEEVSVVESAMVYGGHDYLFVVTPKTWDEAQSYCQLAGGYSLVTINDASEEAFLETQERYRGLYNWWIGANDRGFEGAWGWSNGASSFSNWYPGEPNDADGVEDCAVDRFSWSEGGIFDERWNDYACNRSFAFICERDPAPTANRGSFFYTASNTSSATANTHNQSIFLFAGQVFTAGTCGVPGAGGSGDTYLRINNPNGQEMARNDDAGSDCGLLSNISVVIPATGSYTIRAGCFSSGSCSGTVAYNY